MKVSVGAMSFALGLGLSVSGCDKENGAAPQAQAAPKPVARKPAAPASCSTALFASGGDGRVVNFPTTPAIYSIEGPVGMRTPNRIEVRVSTGGRVEVTPTVWQ